MTCYIVNRKADNFRTSSFTVVIAACVSLCFYIWVICSICVCVCYAVLMLGCPLLRLRLCLLYLCLIRIVYRLSAICVPGLSALSTFSVPHPLYLCLRLLCCTYVSCPLLCLHLCLLYLCLVHVFYSLSAICVPGSFVLSTFSVPYSLCLRLCLLHLCLYLYFFLVVLALSVFYFIFTL